MKKYNTAPLPFQGQKRNFLKTFKEVIKDLPSHTTIIDLFGGSGLLSHTAKQLLPNATVIYNDFDNYAERLANLEKTNNLLTAIRALLGNSTKLRISDTDKTKILFLVKQADKQGYVDYYTLSSNLLFCNTYASNYAELEKSTLYNRIRATDYTVNGYLQGVERVSVDYKELIKKYRDMPNVVFVADPPYLSTDVTTYQTYWRLTEYLEVISSLNGLKMIFFTSNKSNIVELGNWLAKHTNFDLFKTTTTTTTTTVNTGYSSKYIDYLIHNLKAA